jgi:type II secretory ATPase GspE/PulE/Tfp pilus assembly ATPase PilB-like protein
VAFDEEKQRDKIAKLQQREEEDLARLLAQKYKTPYIDLSRISIDIDALKLVPEDRARNAGVAVIQAIGKKLQVAVKNPTLNIIKEELNGLHREGYIVQVFLASLQGLERAWSRYKEIPKTSKVTSNVIDITKENVDEFRSRIKNVQDLQTNLDMEITRGMSTKVTDLLDLILAGAYELEVSDIHVEPEEIKVHLRVRLDGVLQAITTMTHELHKMILSRIKLVSELKLNIHNRAQDGRFTIRTKDIDVEVRVSTLPGPYGESIVMRILHPKAIAMSFENLGMQPPVKALVEKEIKKPNGMIITTGPTGSGKTTTLYAFIKKVREPGIKIITIEDPIEYHLEGISQTQTDHEGNYTFETGLSAIVRQDPDIILVGEIRNRETAEIAMHASLTGHLVFSTLHTNNAPGTIPRLIDLGVTPNIIAPAINIAIAQRLVRVLCPHCRQGIDATPEQTKRIIAAVSTLPPQYERPILDKNKITVFIPVGCDLCNHTGYKGRIGIFEAFLIDDEIERLILRNPSEAEVRAVALKQGMGTLQQDGILKILAGTTSFDELERIAGFE